MGGGDELVILLAPGQGFSVARSGRLYGGLSFFQIEWDGQEMSLFTSQQVTDRLNPPVPVGRA